jgi:lycopene cyclase domain-containing protein
MSYLDIQVLLVPLLCAVLVHGSLRRGLDQRSWWTGVAVLAVIASVWTTPWDNWMVATGVWGYPPDAVIGTVGHIPVEEQAFFVLQTVLTGAFLGLLIGPREPQAKRRHGVRWLAAGLCLGLVVTGAVLFGRGYVYMGSMCVWFGIPLAVQLAWGADQLLRHVGSMVPAIVVPTAILCVLDSLAVTEGTWFFDESTLTGLRLGSLPLEEVVFFGFTNVLIVVGLTLWHELDWAELRRRAGVGGWRFGLQSAP